MKITIGENIKRLRTEKLTELSKTNKPCFDALIERFHADDLLSFAVNSALSWRNPRNLKLLENKEYRAVIEKYV